MNDIIQIVDQIEQRIKNLILRSTELEKENQSIRSELAFYQNRFKQADVEMNDLKKQIQTLKTANALLGSDDFKRETKTKINSIIKEIDYCKAQLSD